jgi:hypothetical protein
MEGRNMTGSTFDWQLVPSSLLRSFKRELGLEGDPATALKDWYGEVPGDEFAKDAWPVLRDRWLGKNRYPREAVVNELRSRRVGDLSVPVRSAAGQMAYLRSCRNSAGLRTAVLETFLTDMIENGDPGPERDTATTDRPTAVPAAAGESAATRWGAYAAALAGALRSLESEQFLILDVHDRAGFIQFAAGGVEGLSAELVSNAYLPPFQQHSTRALARIREIGWLDPEVTPDQIGEVPRSANHRLDWPDPVPFIEVARTAVTTLVEILGLEDPATVRYQSFTSAGTPILIPSLGEAIPSSSDAPQPPAPLDAEQIAQRLLVVLRRETGNDQLERDDAGDIPLRFGSSIVFVRVFGDPPIIRVFSPALGDVSVDSRVLATVNDVNTSTVFTKWLVVDDRIIAVIDLFGRPFDEQHVISACHVVGDTADASDEELQKRLGGRTYFGEYRPPKLPTHHAGYL